MAAKKLALILCSLSFLQTSFAGFERFWIFSKDANAQVDDTWDALSEEEQAEYEIIDEAMSLKDAQKSLKANYGQAHDTHGDFDTERKDQAAAKREFVKAKKVIKKQGGDYNKTKAQAVKKFERENSY